MGPTRGRDAAELSAWRVLLAAAVLHTKWDLQGISAWSLLLSPRVSYRRIRRARDRAVLFHNLALFSTHDLEGFEPERFWADVARFRSVHAEEPDYAALYTAALAGPVSLLAPPVSSR